MVELTRTEGIPLYVKIREELRDEIINGGFRRGQRLPSEDELAAKYSVSRMTVRQGINDLIDEGLIYRRQGVGTFVAFPHIERDHSRLTNFFEMAEAKGIAVRVRLLKAELTPSRAKVASALEIPEGTPVIRVKTLRFADNLPITVHDAFLPNHLFARILEKDLEKNHLWSLFEEYGFRVKRATQRLEARQADAELAALMNIETGAPILYKERVVFAEDGTPVEFTYCYNRGDLYSLTVGLER
jgi:GntR family transcriptional regulator